MVLEPVLAHQGGWDEALFVAVPVVVFFLLLVLANRRANQLRDQRPADDPDTDTGDADADVTPG